VDGLLSASAFRAGQYLTFRLAGREFAVDGERVRGILPLHEMIATAEAPQAPLWAEGFASLGRQYFPVIDLRRKLRLQAPAHGRDPMIVVLEHTPDESLKLVGFVADRISGLVKARERDYRGGKLRTGGRPRRVLDPDALLIPGAF
jgi:chemotaxis signal transduction protein